MAVVSNNLLCLKRDKNIFDSKKRLKRATGKGLKLKLTSGQRGTIARNSALLTMSTVQALGVRMVSNLAPSRAPKLVGFPASYCIGYYFFLGYIAQCGLYPN